MRIGVPKEIKNHEYRVGLSPTSVRELCAAGHKVLIESEAGAAIGFSNAQYEQAGATIKPTAESIFIEAEMIVKVKEPQLHECKQLREGQILFTYLHLAAAPEHTELLLQSNVAAIAYETVTDNHGQLPLLAPMSEVAGRLSIQAGAYHLQKNQGGIGCLLGGVPGVAPANVLIIGGGVVGTQAAIMAVGMGASVTILDRSLPRLRELDQQFKGRVHCVYSTIDAVEHYSQRADLVIGAVLLPGAAAPKVVNRKTLSTMKTGAVVVDVAIDQGGCFETSKPTTHQNPTYVVDNVIHYCVANMPGAVAKTSTLALNNATLPYILALANDGLNALSKQPHLLNGLNVCQGHITHKAVADALGKPYTDPLDVIGC